VKRFGDSAVVLGCRFWIDKPSARRKWRARTAVMEAVKAAFDEAGVKIPFPQRELTGREESGGFRYAETAAAEPGAGGRGDADANSGVDAAPDSDAVVEPSDEDVPTPDGAGRSRNGFGIGAGDYASTFTKAKPPEEDRIRETGGDDDDVRGGKDGHDGQSGEAAEGPDSGWDGDGREESS
jgi:hypothetical protein